MSADSQTPPSSDDSGAAGAGANPFAAGLGLFQDWMKAAGSAMPNMGKAANDASSPMGATLGGMSGLGAWTMPTLDPQELEKRITDLKTVQFWLEQNARMIAMTIQGLEVQRMTLSTLQGMNVSMDALRESLKARAAAKPAAEHEPAPAPAPEPQTDSAATDGSSPAGGQGINPMQWWDTLTQQFTQLASQAAQASVDVGSAATNSMAQAAEAAAAGAAEVVKAAAQPVTTAAKPRPKTTNKPTTKTASTAKKAAVKKPAAKAAKKSTGRGQAD